MWPPPLSEKMKKVVHFLLVICLASCLLGFNPKTTWAQASRNFTVSPPTLKFSLKPGEKTEKRIKITNFSAEKLDFVVTTEDFIVTNKEGTPELLPPGTLPKNRFSASSWSTALPDAFSLEGGKSLTVTLYLQVPANASPGGRYFAVAIKPLGGMGETGLGAAVNTVIGTLVYLTVEGPVSEKAQIVSFTAPRLSEFGPIEFLTEIRNLGDIHLAPQATVEVKNLLGQKVFSFALDNLNIFPGTARIYKNSWEKKWLFGPYVAKLAGNVGKNNPLLAQTTFWVIPYRLIIIVLLALAIVILGLLYLKRSSRPQITQE
jgi:hypothetical protein